MQRGAKDAETLFRLALCQRAARDADAAAATVAKVMRLERFDLRYRAAARAWSEPWAAIIADDEYKVCCCQRRTRVKFARRRIAAYKAVREVERVQRRSNRQWWFVPAAIALAATVAALDGDSGLRPWLALRGELSEAQGRIADLEAEVAALRPRVEALASDRFAIERAIREDLELVRPGETLLRLR